MKYALLKCFLVLVNYNKTSNAILSPTSTLHLPCIALLVNPSITLTFDLLLRTVFYCSKSFHSICGYQSHATYVWCTHGWLLSHWCPSRTVWQGSFSVGSTGEQNRRSGSRYVVLHCVM